MRDYQAKKYLKDILEPVLYEAVKRAKQLSSAPVQEFPRTYRELDSALAGYWALVGGPDNEPEELREHRLKDQKRIAERFRMAVLWVEEGTRLLFLTISRLEDLLNIEYGKDWTVTPEGRLEWLNPRVYGGTPEPEEVGDGCEGILPSAGILSHPDRSEGTYHQRLR